MQDNLNVSFNNQGEMAILFVCTGNICRSPTAEGVMRHKLALRGLAENVRVDSAGTHSYHVGEAPDPRTCQAAAQRGYLLNDLRARQVQLADFSDFNLILAADRQNMALLQNNCPPAYQPRLHYLLASLGNTSRLEVPDPYYGGARGFDRVLDMIEAACDSWISLIEQCRGTTV